MGKVKNWKIQQVFETRPSSQKNPSVKTVTNFLKIKNKFA